MAKTDESLKVLAGWFSPFSVRVNIALNIKGLDYEELQEDFNPKSDLLLKSNPVHRKIPVLLHGDKPVCESFIIVEYIDEVWSNISPSILPSNPYDRASARFWGAYVDDKWFGSMKSILAATDEEGKKTHFVEMEEVIVRMEDLFNKCSEGKGFFGGDHIGFVDIAFGSFLSWLSVIEKMNGRKLLVEEKAPALVKWADRFGADPAVKGLLPDTDKLLEFAKVLQQKWASAAAGAN